MPLRRSDPKPARTQSRDPLCVTLTPNNNTMNIVYSFDKRQKPDQIIELNDNAGLPRPTNDKERIQKMLDNSNLIITT